MRAAQTGQLIHPVGFGYHQKRRERVIGQDKFPHSGSIGGGPGQWDRRLERREINAPAEVARLTGQRGPEVVIEATGNPAVVPLCLELVGRGGSVVLLGSTRGRVEIDAYSHIHIYETLAQNPPAYLGVLIDWQRNHV